MQGSEIPIMYVQNPGAGDPPNAGLQNKADYKGSQKKQFGGYRWIGCHDPSLLDMERCEFLFIGARGGEDIKGMSGLLNVLHIQIVVHMCWWAPCNSKLDEQILELGICMYWQSMCMRMCLH